MPPEILVPYGRHASGTVYRNTSALRPLKQKARRHLDDAAISARISYQRLDEVLQRQG